MKTQFLACVVSLLAFLPPALPAQVQRERDVAPLKHWPAPLYWQPTQMEGRAIAEAAGTPSPQATAPPNSLVFVGMTPCRVVDTRGAAGTFGGPSLTGGATRSFPLAIQTGNPCPIPASAQAYSLNVTVVPSGFLGFLTIWPQSLVQPTVSTLNDSFGQVLANAAVVPSGSPNGGVSVFALNNTDLVIDINGYYAPQSGLTLAQGTAAAPSMSFVGDAGTGVFSSGAGTLDFATGGANRLTVRPDGDLDLPGSVRKGGTLFLHSLGNSNTGLGLSALAENTTGSTNTTTGNGALAANTTGCCNSAFGFEALYGNTASDRNTAMGHQALGSNLSGSNNTATGFGALLNNITGINNTAAGDSAL